MWVLRLSVFYEWFWESGSRRFLVLLFAFSFLVRLAAAVALRDLSQGPGTELGQDGLDFNTLGLSLARGEGYVLSGKPTAFRAPGFPLFLGALYHVFGERHVVAYLAFCTLGALACVVAYSLGREFLGEKSGRITGLLAAVYVPHVYSATVFGSETLFVPVVGLAALVLLRYLRTLSLVALCLAGFTLGWAVLTRPYALFIVGLWLMILLWAEYKRRKPRAWRPVLFVVGCAIAVSPWTLRNYAVFAEFVPVATNGGSTFYGSNNDLVLNDPARYGSWVSTIHLPGRDVIEAQPDEVSHDRMEWSLGLHWVRTNLGALPRLMAYKFLRFWSPDVESGNREYVALQLATYTPFLVLIAVGVAHCLASSSRWCPAWWVIHSTIIATTVTALVFAGTPRFRDANAAFLMIYSCVGLQSLFARISTGRQNARASSARRLRS